MYKSQGKHPLRTAWVEINLAQLRRNFQIINNDKPANLPIVSVVKDQAYGHGAVQVAKVALQSGAVYLAVATIDEALELRQNGITAPILLFGERHEEELKVCIERNITCFVNDLSKAEKYSAMVKAAGEMALVHIEVDTGLSRYGVRWTEALPVIEAIAKLDNPILEGVMSHFAMSDESDKSFAKLQIDRFHQVLNSMNKRGIRVKYRHICNSGGYLDLPQAHFDLIRIGILPLGVYPSQVCRRIAELQPVMSVKAKVAAIRDLEVGDVVGYGMRYRASTPRRIAVIPLGYGDGYPRVRNKGEVLIHGKRAPIIGGIAMDAMMVDITEIPKTCVWDEVVLMGHQGQEEISVHDIAQLKGSVSYDILNSWSWRLPRIYLNLN
ncbi:MAG: alanine racemase [bacterium]